MAFPAHRTSSAAQALQRIIVAYAVAADGQLHVVGLQSGKDLQKPAPFLPANSQWSNPVAVGTMMYAATSGNCAGAPNGVYAIDLDAPDNKRVVSYHTNGGSVVGAVAFSSDGNTLFAAIGPGSCHRKRKSKRHRCARSENTAAEGLVHAAYC